MHVCCVWQMLNKMFTEESNVIKHFQKVKKLMTEAMVKWNLN